MNDKVVVRFLKAWRGYSADELAGFDEAVVEGLKSKGFAEVYEGDGSPPKSKAKKSPGKSGRQSTPRAGTGDGEGSGDDGGAGAGTGDIDEKP